MPPQEMVNAPVQSEIQATPTPAPTPIQPLAIGKFKASQMIVKQSWTLLMQDKEIMWFPVFSSIAGIVALLIMGTVYFFVSYGGDINNLEQSDHVATQGGGYVALLVYYIVMMFIVNFFETGIYIIAHARFNGGDLSFSDGLNGAVKNSGKIFVWSCVTATVGVLLQIISDRSRLIGKIVASLLGAAWNILTYFSLPSLIIGGKGVQDAFKESAAVIRKNWGETIIINLGVGLFFLGIIGVLTALFIGVTILAQSGVVFVILLFLYVIAMILLAVISSALSSIFKLAIYEYATTGKVPSGFSPELIQHAVHAKV